MQCRSDLVDWDTILVIDNKYSIEVTAVKNLQSGTFYLILNADLELKKF